MRLYTEEAIRQRLADAIGDDVFRAVEGLGVGDPADFFFEGLAAVEVDLAVIDPDRLDHPHGDARLFAAYAALDRLNGRRRTLLRLLSDEGLERDGAKLGEEEGELVLADLAAGALVDIAQAVVYAIVAAEHG